jgi:hypothetical protein
VGNSRGFRSESGVSSGLVPRSRGGKWKLKNTLAGAREIARRERREDEKVLSPPTSPIHGSDGEGDRGKGRAGAIPRVRLCKKLALPGEEEPTSRTRQERQPPVSLRDAAAGAAILVIFLSDPLH